jgi:protein-S-isoprenylcysteine O-methyltransferase Ste14
MDREEASPYRSSLLFFGLMQPSIVHAYPCVGNLIRQPGGSETMSKVIILFWATVSLELVYVILFILTIKLPNFRFWPPPKPRSWQFFLSWLIAGVVAVNFLLLGLLDFDSFTLPCLKQRLPFALGFFVIGEIIGGWALHTLGLRNTIGVDHTLITNGPYRYSRNPQYIGDCLTIIGYMVFANSWMTWMVGLLGVGLNLLAPFTEEPWLEERYGEEYKVYQRTVPRFIGRRNT